MSKELLVKGEVMHASVKKMLNIEEFLLENYLFRQNLLNGKVEYAMKQADGTMGEFVPLTKKSLNSIILRAKENADEEMGNPQADIKMYVDSDEVCRVPELTAQMGRTQLCGRPLWQDSRHQYRTALIPGYLDSFRSGSLAPDGHASRQRGGAYADRSAGLRKDHFPSTPVA